MNSQMTALCERKEVVNQLIQTHVMNELENIYAQRMKTVVIILRHNNG